MKEMQKVMNYLLMVVLVVTICSCGSAPKKESLKKSGKRKKTSDIYSLKGTNTEIMTAFKNVLPRQEFETFSQVSLTIVTKPKKMDETNPNHEKHKRKVDIFEQYVINMTRKGYDMVVDIKYLILIQEMNMKTNVIGFKEVARVRKAEEELINTVKRLLYGS